MDRETNVAQHASLNFSVFARISLIFCHHGLGKSVPMSFSGAVKHESIKLVNKENHIFSYRQVCISYAITSEDEAYSQSTKNSDPTNSG